jgi:hypothetical protein
MPEGVSEQIASIICPRCKQPFALYSNDLSERTLDDMKELQDFNKRMGENEDDFPELLAGKEGDSVEDALERADETFKTARKALDEIALESTAESIDAEQLLQRYFVPDVK